MSSSNASATPLHLFKSVIASAPQDDPRRLSQRKLTASRRLLSRRLQLLANVLSAQLDAQRALKLAEDLWIRDRLARFVILQHGHLLVYRCCEVLLRELELEAGSLHSLLAKISRLIR